MNDICVENCAIKRDTSGFQIKPDLKLADMPKFPDTVDMTREEKFTSVVVYLSKLVEEAQGEDNGYLPPIPVGRPHTHTPSGGRVSTVIPIQNLLHAVSEAVTPPETGTELANTDVRPTEVAQPAD
jgi:hypothetical protein